jgi:hypothetical protein
MTVAKRVMPTPLKVIGDRLAKLGNFQCLGPAAFSAVEDNEIQKGDATLFGAESCEPLLNFHDARFGPLHLTGRGSCSAAEPPPESCSFQTTYQGSTETRSYLRSH